MNFHLHYASEWVSKSSGRSVAAAHHYYFPSLSLSPKNERQQADDGKEAGCHIRSKASFTKTSFPDPFRSFDFGRFALGV